VKTVAATPPVEQRPNAAGNQRFFGHIASIDRAGTAYLVRFDPLWFLSGITANVAQAQDQHVNCRPTACPPVANDNYRVDERHRLLTFLLPASARGTVLKQGSANGFAGDEVTAAQLAQIVVGKSSLKLFEPLTSGVWLLVHIDTVRSFAQQYQP
jgi:hypothetical protein